MRRFSIALIGIVVAITLFVALFTFTARAYEDVVLDRFGNIVGNPTRIMYNWYLCLPTDRVVRMDKRLHLYQSILQQVSTHNAEVIAVKTFAAWQIKDASLFYKTNGGSDENAKKQIEQKIQGLVQQIIPSHSLDEIFNTDQSKVQTENIETEITDRANDSLKEQGLKIARVGFSRMAFSPQVASSVYQRMSAEREKLTSQFLSLGEARASEIQNEGRTNAANLRAEAERKAQQVRGDGDAQALAILAQAQPTPEARDFYQYWKSIDTLKNALSKNAYLVLSADNPLLRPILNAPTGGGIKTAEQIAPPANNAVAKP